MLRPLIEDFANFPRQLLDAEGLAQEIGAGIEHPVMHDGVARIAGRIEHLEVWPFPARAIGQLPSGHLRHDDVGKQERDLLIVVEHLHRLLRTDTRTQSLIVSGQFQ